MPFNIGPLEWVIILFIVLLVFGAGKLPQLGSSLGKGIRNFRDSLKGEGKNSEKTEEESGTKK